MYVAAGFQDVGGIDEQNIIRLKLLENLKRRELYADREDPAAIRFCAYQLVQQGGVGLHKCYAAGRVELPADSIERASRGPTTTDLDKALGAEFADHGIQNVAIAVSE